jgi:hypothetical protein
MGDAVCLLIHLFTTVFLRTSVRLTAFSSVSVLCSFAEAPHPIGDHVETIDIAPVPSTYGKAEVPVALYAEAKN